MAIAAMKLMAVSLDLPKSNDHPNRMPFSGILTRVDVASDKPPHGSNGKKVLLTRAAAEAALDSLLGMGVDLTKDMDGHDAQHKVGLITGAHIEGDALMIAGFIYAADFPREAQRIHLEQADLGFSFEARNLAVESMDTDPLVVKSCVFTGAAILLKSDAAYTTTALAAAAAKEHEMTDEMTKALKAALDAALGPVTTALGEVKASQAEAKTAQDELKTAQAAQAAALEDLKKNPPQILHAVSATVAKIEPHATRMEAAADQMEKDGIGLHATQGHVNQIRRMADSMRADAALGKVPHAYHDSGSYWASGDRRQPEPQQPAQQTVKIEETAEFKAMQASFDQQAKDLKTAQDAAAALGTKFDDLNAKLTGLRPAPDRKTIEPGIANLLARAGLTAPEEGGTLAIGKVDAALAAMPEMSTTQRMHLKTALGRAGVLSPSGT
jgi:hypothetical protein